MWLSEIFYGVCRQVVRPRIVIPICVGSIPIRHPKQIPQWRNWKTHFFQKKDVEGSNPSWGTNDGSLIQWIEYHVPIVVIQVRFL
jgi:hypothetical protein